VISPNRGSFSPRKDRYAIRIATENLVSLNDSLATKFADDPRRGVPDYQLPEDAGKAFPSDGGHPGRKGPSLHGSVRIGLPRLSRMSIFAAGVIETSNIVALSRRDAQRGGRLQRRVSRLRLRMNIDDIHFGTRAISMGAVHA